MFENFRAVLVPYVESNPDLHVLIAAPQFSRVPSWYSTSLGLCMDLLKRLVLDFSQLPNLHLLPSQVSQVAIPTIFLFHLYRLDPFPYFLFLFFYLLKELESDGIHLTALSGYQYVRHLFDSALALISHYAMPIADQVSEGFRNGTMLSSRVSLLEQQFKSYCSRGK